MRQTEKLLTALAILVANFSLAQKPREIQVDMQPPYWESTATIIVLVVVPVIMLIFGIIWYKRRKRKLREFKDHLDESESPKG